MTPKIEKLIVKYITKSATAADMDTLSEWIKKPSNKQVFKDYVQTHYAITYAMNNPESQKALERLLRTIRKEKSWVYKLKTQPVFKYTAAAAILIMALASTYLLKDTLFNNQIENNTPLIVNNQIEPGSDKATLTLETGETIALEEGKQFQIQNATSNGEEIIYNTINSSASPELVFNYLTIPRGGQFRMTLSDGTKVWLNSETQLKYPVSFTDGESRQVELVYGEAYFEVSPSTEHKGADFKVYHKHQEVQVLGTEFNIKAYKDETNIYTTLVEGKVAVSYARKNQILAPNQQSNLNTQNNNLSIAIVDVNRVTAWKQGVFLFKEKPLKEIMIVLTRWYDMEVVFKNKELETVTFSGTFNKNHPIEDILEAIKNTKFINGYEIHNKTITIK